MLIKCTPIIIGAFHNKIYFQFFVEIPYSIIVIDYCGKKCGNNRKFVLKW